jgi:hypothetical protein
VPGAVSRHRRLSGSHLLPPRPLWLFLWIWLERKSVPGRYGLTHPLWPQAWPRHFTLTCTTSLPQSSDQCPLYTQPAVNPGPICAFVDSEPSLLTRPPLFLACAPGHFGADCRLQCQCQNGGTCDRFSGCVCPSGWHGVHCEKSGMSICISETPQDKSAPTGWRGSLNPPFPVNGPSPALRECIV